MWTAALLASDVRSLHLIIYLGFMNIEVDENRAAGFLPKPDIHLPTSTQQLPRRQRFANIRRKYEALTASGDFPKKNNPGFFLKIGFQKGTAVPG